MEVIARRISVVFHPIGQVYVVLLVVGARSGWHGFALALVAATFIAGVPALVLWRFVRAGLVDDMDVSRRGQRPLVLSLSMMSLAAGVAVLLLLGAPAALLRVIAMMGLGVVASALVSLRWKASIHTAVTVGSVMSTGVVVSPWLLLLTPVIGVVGWARVITNAHTWAQVTAGAFIGLAISVVLIPDVAG